MEEKADGSTGERRLAPAQSEAIFQKPLVILVVDDDAIVLMNTAAMLEDLGHIALEADTASEAVEHLRSRSDIDLLITDQAMPVMTGNELIGEARRCFPDLPIILATGYGEMAESEHMNVSRLAKPFTQANLQKAIADVIAGETG